METVQTHQLGNRLTAVAAGLFFVICMLLPLVGKAGMATDHVGANVTTFLVFLLPALACAGLGLRIKWRAWKQGQDGVPWISGGLSALYALLLLALVTGLLAK